MVIIWGSGMYGKVDEVPGICHVATRFGHLWYLPLIPMGTYAVFDEEGDGFRGASLPLSGKSILMAWVRTAMFLAFAISAIFIFVTWGTVGMAVAGAFTAVTLGAFIASLRLGRSASYSRAKEIAASVGLPDEATIIIDVFYGRLDPDEAEEALSELAEEREAEEEEERDRRREKAARRRERRMVRADESGVTV